MCTRFYIEPETEELKEIMEAARRSPLTMRFIRNGDALLTSGEIRPTNVVPVIAPGKNGQKAVFPMKWGFQIPGRSLLVNARAETAKDKSTFKEAWERHRCIIPSSWYFEWEHLIGSNGQKKTGDKYMIQPVNATVTWLTGLYRIEDGLPYFTVLTREPSEELKRIHDRMPVILPENCIGKWIDPDGIPEEVLKESLTEMLAEKTG